MECLQRLTAQSPSAHVARSSRRGADKVAVLHSATAEIQRLQSVVQQMKAREDELQQRLHDMQRFACMCHNDSQRTLSASSLIRTSIALILYDGAGTVLDVNEQFIRQSGWTRKQLLGTLIGSDDWTLVPPQLGCPAVTRVTTDGRLHHIGQYDSSKALMEELFAGTRHKVEAMFRMLRADGVLVESSHTSWLQQAEGGLERGEILCVMASAFDDSVHIDMIPSHSKVVPKRSHQKITQVVEKDTGTLCHRPDATRPVLRF